MKKRFGLVFTILLMMLLSDYLVFVDQIDAETLTLKTSISSVAQSNMILTPTQPVISALAVSKVTTTAAAWDDEQKNCLITSATIANAANTTKAIKGILVKINLNLDITDDSYYVSIWDSNGVAPNYNRCYVYFSHSSTNATDNYVNGPTDQAQFAFITLNNGAFGYCIDASNGGNDKITYTVTVSLIGYVV